MIVPATNALAGRNAFLQREDDKQRAEGLQQLMLDRQAKQDALAQALGQRTLRTPVLGDPGYAKAQGDVAGAQADAKVPAAVSQAQQISPITTQTAANTAAAVSPITTRTAVNTAAGVAPIKVKEAADTAAAVAPIKTKEAVDTARQTSEFAPPIATQDRPGDPSSPVTYKTRSQALGTGKAPGVAGAGSPSAQAQQARLLAAVSEARLADERMRAYEDKLLNKTATISPFKQAAGSLTTNLADSHGVLGALTQAGSEYGLNSNDPEYAQYLRDASTIGRAEQMMSPRGGNETMVRANALLSRAGSGAMANTINASRMARQALFGQSGGIAQTLNPQQTQKLEQGVANIKAGEHGSSAPVAGGNTAVINGKTYVIP